MATGKKTGGRTKGTPNAKTAERKAEIAAGGELPLDYALRIMRDPSETHERRDWACGQAMRFCHAALNESKNKHEHDVSDPLAALLAEIAGARNRIYDKR